MCLWSGQSVPARLRPASQPRRKERRSSLSAGRSEEHQHPARPYPHKARQRPHNPEQKSPRLYAPHQQCRRYSHPARSSRLRFPHAGHKPHQGHNQQFAAAVQPEEQGQKAGGYWCRLQPVAGGHITPLCQRQCGPFQKFQTSGTKTSHCG